jgi:heme-degrading monooxygenase HmoA
VIARVWRGTARADAAPEYLAHLRDTVFPEIGAIDGNRGALVLQRVEDGTIEFTVITLWDSIDAIRRFAGPDAEAAVVAPRAQALLATWERRVSHYEVPLTAL